MFVAETGHLSCGSIRLGMISCDPNDLSVSVYKRGAVTAERNRAGRLFSAYQKENN
jgi:hypothetical protein